MKEYNEVGDAVFYNDARLVRSGEKAECKTHSYYYSGTIPCTGAKVCHYCGKIEGRKEHRSIIVR